MKKICFFVGNLNLSGGTERVSTSIANELAKIGYEVLMLNLWEGESPFFTLNPNVKNYQIYSCRVSFLKNYLKTVYKLRKFLKKHQITDLIVVESMLSLFSLPASTGLPIQHITWEHFNYNVDLGKKSRKLARYMSRLFSDKIVTLTERDRQIWLTKTIGKADIISIPNPSPYLISKNIPKLENKVVLAVGRLTYQKGFDLLIDAWKIVKDNPKLGDWKLRIIGEGEDKELLDSLIQSSHLQSSVELLPFSNKINKFYESASIYCLSSRFEGLPMVLIETQSFGLPTVAFDCDTGPKEIIEHNRSGYLCEAENINDLAKNLEKMMLIHKEDYVAMSNEAKKIMSDKFEINKIIGKWVSIL